MYLSWFLGDSHVFKSLSRNSIRNFGADSYGDLFDHQR